MESSEKNYHKRVLEENSERMREYRRQKKLHVQDLERQVSELRMQVAAQSLLALAPTMTSMSSSMTGTTSTVRQRAINGLCEADGTCRRKLTWHRKLCEISDESLQTWRKFLQRNQSKGGCIQKPCGRKQIPFQLSDLPTKLRAQLDYLVRFFRLAYPDHDVSCFTLLYSEENCTLQLPHYDYKLTKRERNFLAKPENEHSFSVLLSLDDNANLPMWEDESNLDDFVVLTLNQGDALVFRDDVLHAGGIYAAGHFARIHFYLESKRIKHLREYVHRLCLSPADLQRLHNLVADYIEQQG